MSTPSPSIDATLARFRSDVDRERVRDAAPEMLAALERLVGEHADLGEVDCSSEERDALEQARAAIAKAVGST